MNRSIAWLKPLSKRPAPAKSVTARFLFRTWARQCASVRAKQVRELFELERGLDDETCDVVRRFTCLVGHGLGSRLQMDRRARQSAVRRSSAGRRACGSGG